MTKNKIWIAAALVVLIALSIDCALAAGDVAAPPDRPQMSAEEQAEKRRVFEERLAKLEAEFQKKHEEIRQRIEEFDQEFRGCRKATPEEVLADFAKRQKEKNRMEAEVHVQKGAACYENGEYKNALGEYDKAVALDPENAAAYAGRAKVYYLAEAYERALADAEEAVALHPDFAPAYEICAFVRIEQKDYEGALSDINRAMSLEPENDLWYLVRASVYGAQGDVKSFFDDLNRGWDAPEAEKKLKEIDLLGRGFVHYVENDKHDAAHYTQIIEVNPNAEKALWNRAQYYDECGAYEEAAADYAKAIELNPDRIEYYEERAYFYYRNGRFEEEAADLERARELSESL